MKRVRTGQLSTHKLMKSPNAQPQGGMYGGANAAAPSLHSKGKKDRFLLQVLERDQLPCSLKVRASKSIESMLLQSQWDP
jgi:hypothetical protein